MHTATLAASGIEEYNTIVSLVVEPLYSGHHWDPAGCPVYSGTSL